MLEVATIKADFQDITSHPVLYKASDPLMGLFHKFCYQLENYKHFVGIN